MRQGLLKTVAALTLAAAIIVSTDVPPLSVGHTVYAAEVCEEHIHNEGGNITAETKQLDIRQYAASSVAAPTASKKSGTIKCSGNSTSVKLTAGSGATIYYSLNGGSYKKYSSAIKLTKNSTLKTYAIKGGTKSSVVTYRYKLKPKLSFSISGSGSGKKVFISTETSGVTIYYTTDGSKPTTDSEKYTSSGITLTKTSTVKALAVKSGWTKASYSKKVTVGGSGSSGNTESGGGSSSGGNVVTKGSETVKCNSCYSLGTCQECYGTGQKYNAILGYMDCNSCNGTGNCSICGGKGEVSVEVNIINEDAVPEGKEFNKCVICQGTGICYMCNGLKVSFGALDCRHCNATGICSNCNGSGGELKDKPKPEPSTGGGSSGGSSGTTPTPVNPRPGLNICFACNGTKQCNYCHGLRRCPTCFGKGGRSVPTYGTGMDDWVTCTACHGSGNCKRCNGTGRCTTCGGF